MESESILPSESDDHIRDSEESMKSGSRPDLDSLDPIIGDIQPRDSEPPPSDIDHDSICRNPDIIIPVTELVHQNEIHQDDPSGDLPRSESRLESEGIIDIEDSWDSESEKYPYENILEDHENMPMKYLIYRIRGVDISREENTVESIHGEGGDLSRDFFDSRRGRRRGRSGPP